MRGFLIVAAELLIACTVFSQDATVPPAAQHPVLTVEGRGVQIYSCGRSEAGTVSWVFVAPVARLFDKEGVEVGTHGDGPVWHLQDGSSVMGKVVAKLAPPDAQSVPWLLLKAVSTTGTGTLEAVEYIRRSETKGGVAPGTGCDAGHLGDMVRVPYSATYTFYSSK